MDPDTSSPNPVPAPAPTPPLFNGPFRDPLITTPVVSTSEPVVPVVTPKTINKKLFIIIAIVAAVELLVILLLLAALANQPKSNQSKINNLPSSSRSEEPKPTTSVGIQQANDSISADISSLNDEQDFPDGKFDDKAIGL